MKRWIAFVVSIAMAVTCLPFSAFAASTYGVTMSFDGFELWFAPNGSFFDTAVEEAFEDWKCEVEKGYTNVRSYTEGVTLQYYANGSECVSSVTSPGYGKMSEKLIIEWKMKKTDNAGNLKFDFEFTDLNDKVFATVSFEEGNEEISESYPLGFPSNSTECAIVAYNNGDGVSHSVEYYINRTKVFEKTNLSGKFDGFKAIKARGDENNTAWAHVGFADLTVGAVYAKEYTRKTVCVDYYADGYRITEDVGTYMSGIDEGYVFEERYFFYDSDVWYAPEMTCTKDVSYNLTRVERYATKKKGDTLEFDGVKYTVTGQSAVVNGNFVTGDATGWTNRLGTDVTDYNIVHDDEIGANVLSIKSGGKNDTNSIGTSWSVKSGQKYYLSFYVGGEKPEENNYKYNRVFQSDKETSIVDYGENMEKGTWVRFEKIIVPTGNSIYFQSSWLSGEIMFANFELIPIEEYVENQTKLEVVEDAFVKNNILYGINSANADGLMVASFEDGNRGPEKDANGETTYLENSSPTTLGSSRVGLVKFPVADLEENEKAVFNFYVREWHSQGFDGGNTFLRIAVTPLNSSSWADLSENSRVEESTLEPLTGWKTPVFSQKAGNSPGFVKVDVTEIMHAAKALGMEYISFKMQIYYGAAYCVEREAALEGTYENLASFIQIEEPEKLFKLNVSGDAVLTKNGSAMHDACYVDENDEIRLQTGGKKYITSDAGIFENNKKITVTRNMNITNTVPLDFGLKMVDGAQIRYGGGVDENGNLNSENGLRFITLFEGNETLAGEEDAELGVIISTEQNDTTLQIEAKKWQNDTTFTTAITNMATSNFNRKFTATPYVTIDGQTFTGEGVTRSIYQVASGLLINGDDINTDYGETSEKLFDVLNAYVNQVGIRLTFSDNADFTDWELTEREDGVGSYNGKAFFEVGETEVDGKVYMVKLTPKGEKTVIKDNWKNYIRINNNNSQVKLCTVLENNNDGTYTLKFDTTNLNMGTYPEEKYNAMKPTYDRAVAAMEKANKYWQENQSYVDTYGGTHPAFWDKAAYHTGNIEMYKLTQKADYLSYSVNWANYNEWKGNNSTLDKSKWTWGYNQTQGSSAVLFGDWQICFQTYIDLYDMGVESANLDRVYEVMDYQLTKDEDGFWWWADALYMVMPVMTKLYAQTNDEKYLDGLYKYFKYAKELMYDGPGGIPTDESGYTTSARLSSGAEYSDEENYKYLFYRDSGYVYPLNPNSGHESEKNFWARGNGWVFAGLCKVLSDMPKDYEHYDEFYNTYVEMAKAVAQCQQTDSSGYGFWTQSMLQDYPKGSNNNAEGYETSGTAFLTYGLFWGINNGILKEDIYEKAAVRAWAYLEKKALHESGKVGYVQPIGSNATQAVSYDTTANFGVGAYLLACCEAARWAES